MNRLIPKTLRGRLILLILGALVLAQALSFWLFADERSAAVRTALALEAADRAANVVLLLNETAADQHPGILRAANSPLVQFTVEDVPTVQTTYSEGADEISQRVRRLLGVGNTDKVRVDLRQASGERPPMAGTSGNMVRMHNAMNSAHMSAIEMRLSILLADGEWLNVSTRFHAPAYQMAWKGAAPFAITAFLLAGVLWLALGRLIRPIRTLAINAEKFGRGETTKTLTPTGPAELAHLTVAFNDMQDRIKRFVDERTRLLGAIGHDLRSPLTALRVRAEMVDDEETRTRMIETIKEMHDMIEATLTFARGMAESEEAKTVRLSDFLDRLVRDVAETGGDVRFAGAPDTACLVRPNALRRALRNLIENALKYAGSAVVRGADTPDHLTILVEDTGPGLPSDSLERVFDPFVRLEPSRSRETGGTGLGLSIARSIVQAHGGDIWLENRNEGGLRATIRLPLGRAERT